MTTTDGPKAFKVVLLGEGRVGKTCLCLRYVQNSFTDNQESTIQATYLDKRLNLGKKSVRLMIWDTAGQERFHALGPIYYREANGALLVYDITDRESFSKVRNWVHELRAEQGMQIQLVIAGNKSDLEKKRQVDNEEAKKYAESVGAAHMLCSAKSGSGVEEVFLELTKLMMQDDAKKLAAAAGENQMPDNKRKVVAITNDNSKAKQDTGCCG